MRGSYSKSETPLIPYVSVKVYTPTKSKSIEVEAKIDIDFLVRCCYLSKIT